MVEMRGNADCQFCFASIGRTNAPLSLLGWTACWSLSPAFMRCRCSDESLEDAARLVVEAMTRATHELVRR